MTNHVGIGELEYASIALMFAQSKAHSFGTSDVVTALGDRSPALTTVSITLGRLAKKGMLEELAVNTGGRAKRYAVTEPGRAEVIAARARYKRLLNIIPNDPPAINEGGEEIATRLQLVGAS